MGLCSVLIGVAAQTFVFVCLLNLMKSDGKEEAAAAVVIHSSGCTHQQQCQAGRMEPFLKRVSLTYYAARSRTTSTLPLDGVCLCRQNKCVY